MSGRQSIMIINQLEVGQWINVLIQQDNIVGFYENKLWRRLRREVLRADKYECQICKGKGYYTKANHVHHINYVRKHPELALETHYKDNDGNIKRNLISVCKNCHETVCHPERLRWNVKEQITKERW